MNPEQPTAKVLNHETTAEPTTGIPPTLVVERLRLEAILTGNEPIAIANAIVLSFFGMPAVITVNQRQDAAFAVTIQTHVGEALLADEARLILESGIVNVGEQRAEVGETGLVTVQWEGTYAGQVDVAAVSHVLRENLHTAFNLQQAMAEDCYLRRVELPELLIRKGRP